MKHLPILLALLAAPPLALAQAPEPGHTPLPQAAVVASNLHLQQAKQAFAGQQIDAMWKHLDRAVRAIDPAAKTAKARQLRTFLASLEPLLLPADQLRQGTCKERVTKLLKHARSNARPGKSAALTELLAREPRANHLLRHAARHEPSPARRLAALAALARRPEPGNQRFVLRTAVVDRSKLVRKDCLDIMRNRATAQHAHYLGAGLQNASGKVRIRAAEALANLGHPAAIELLVNAGPHAATGLAAPRAGANDGTTTRGHVAFMTQTSYVRDFDVEVASAAFIADPKVDVLQSGTVLDATVMGVTNVRTIRRAYRRALRSVAGKDPGRNPALWGAKLEKQLTAARAAAKRAIEPTTAGK